MYLLDMEGTYKTLILTQVKLQTSYIELGIPFEPYIQIEAFSHTRVLLNATVMGSARSYIIPIQKTASIACPSYSTSQ